MVTIWIAEAENGTINFDTEPSVNDVREVCQDLDGDIQVFQVELTEISRKLYLNLNENER